MLGLFKKIKNRYIHRCICCKELKRTDLILDDGNYVCDDCAQIQGELADMEDQT